MISNRISFIVFNFRECEEKNFNILTKVFGREEKVITFVAPKGKNVPVDIWNKVEDRGKYWKSKDVSIWFYKDRLGADFLWKVL